MNVYTYSEARRRLADLLDQVTREGEVRIRRRDGNVFVIRLVRGKESPLDVEDLELGFSDQEILKFVHEGRREGCLFISIL